MDAMDNGLELARGLSVQEVAVMACMSDGEFVYPAAMIAADAGVPVHVTKKIMKSFRQRGWAQHGHLRGEDSDHVLGSGTWLTDAGLQIQRHLPPSQNQRDY
jgi:hypothetical protein